MEEIMDYGFQRPGVVLWRDRPADKWMITKRGATPAEDKTDAASHPASVPAGLVVKAYQSAFPGATIGILAKEFGPNVECLAEAQGTDVVWMRND